MTSARNLFFTAFLGLALCVQPSLSQGARGTISGTVTDASGGVLPGVSVTVANVETGVLRTVVTSQAGLYVVPNLEPGPYTVRAELPGFQYTTVGPVVLNVASRMTVDVMLEVSPVADEVTVAADSQLLQRGEASIGQVIQQQAVADLPLDGRNFLQLALLSAGAVPISPTSNEMVGANFRTSVNISGGRNSSNQFTIDGVFNNAAQWQGLNIELSVDAIREFNVQRNTFSAEYGQGTAQVNVATRSGTNEFHGSVFHFVRNDVLDARQFFDAEVPPFRQNQFGVSVGGPILRNKTFFFVNYEGLRRRRANTFIGTLPSTTLLSGDFSGLAAVTDPQTGEPFPDNIIPQERFSPLTQRIIQHLPALTVGGANNFRTTQSTSRDFDQMTVRIDHEIDDRNRLSGRYTFFDLGIYQPALVDNTGNNISDLAQNAYIDWTHMFSPSLTNQARIGFNRNHLERIQEGDTNILQQANIVPEPTSFGLPAVAIQGFSTFGSSIVNPLENASNTFQYSDNVSYVTGNHSIRFGVDVRNVQFPTTAVLFGRGNFSFTGVATGNPVADFLLGHPFVSLGAGRQPTYMLDRKLFNAYIQDDWRVAPRLTLNLGLRYERESDVRDRYRGRVHTFDPAAGEFVSGSEVDARGLSRANNLNFAPRFGLAWRAARHTVLRGGYGVFYDVHPVNERGLGVANDFAFQQIVDVNPLVGLPPAILWDELWPADAPLVGTGLFSSDPFWKSPYVHQFSFGIQQLFTPQLIGEVLYAGSVGRRLFRRTEFNQATLPSVLGEPLPPRRRYPDFGSIIMGRNVVDSNYHSLQTRLERRFFENLSFLASYTFSKSIDNGSSAVDNTSGVSGIAQNNHALEEERGLSAFNQAHRFVGSFIYQLPVGREQRHLNSIGRLADAFLGGWQVNGIVTLASGFPISAQTAGGDRSQTGAGAGGVQRPNVVGSAPANLPSSERTVQRWFNTDAFEPAPLGTFGNAGRNTIIGPPTKLVDFSVFKNFAVTEDVKVQFRTEFFNLFNRANFGLPIANPLAAAFGQITSVGPAREIQFALKITF